MTDVWFVVYASSPGSQLSAGGDETLPRPLEGVMLQKASHRPPVRAKRLTPKVRKEPPSRPRWGNRVTQSLLVMNPGMACVRWAIASQTRRSRPLRSRG